MPFLLKKFNDVNDDEIEAIGYAVADPLAPCPLGRLSSCNRSFRRALKALVKQIKEQRLKVEDLCNHVGESRDLRELTTLDWNFKKFTTVHLETLRMLLSANRLPQLLHLSLNLNFIGDEDAKAIAATVAASDSLVHLNLRVNDIGDQGANAIAAGVAASGSLTHLTVNNNKIGNKGAKAIASSVLASGSLTHLDTRNNNIFGEAAEQLAKAVLESKSMLTFGEVPMQQLRANELTELNLRFTALGPTEAHVLSSLVAASGSLTRLELSNNKIGVEGAKAIAAAVAASGSLTHLTLRENKIGDEGAAAVAAAMAASDSLALKQLVVDYALLQHAELVAACKSKGVKLSWFTTIP